MINSTEAVDFLNNFDKHRDQISTDLAVEPSEALNVRYKEFKAQNLLIKSTVWDR